MITQSDKLSPELKEWMLSEFDKLSAEHLKLHKRKSFAFTKNVDGKEVGFVEGGLSSFGWCHVDNVFVSEESRLKGYGKELMDQVEVYAKENNRYGVLLATQAFQAPSYYEKLGYEKYGELSGFAGEYSRIYYVKRF